MGEARLSILDHLTPKQAQVLQGVADGKDRKQIAQELWISLETVKSHLKEVRYRLDANTTTQAVAIALRRQLIA